MLEMLNEHHDEDLCTLQAVRPVVRKAVRRLGMVYDYDVSRSVPGMPLIVLTGTFQTVKCDPKLVAKPTNTFIEQRSVDSNSGRCHGMGSDLEVQKQAQQVQVPQRGHCYRRSQQRRSGPRNCDQF